MMKVVKRIKLTLPFDKFCVNSLYEKIVPNVQAVEKELQIESSEKIFKNMTNSKLQEAAELFLYLNSCSDVITKWLIFYNDLFTKESPDQIVLTLNRVLKGDQKIQNRSFKNIAYTLLRKAATTFSLKYQEIQNFTKGLAIAPSVNFSKDLVSHPVHFLNKKNQKFPSAFIPFCDFGGNMSAMGVKINPFDVPVCNSFKAKVRNDQYCYEVDLNKFSNKNNIENELKFGFVFIMDYNEDRQMTFHEDLVKVEDRNLAIRILKSDENQHASIYLDTIGKFNKKHFRIE